MAFSMMTLCIEFSGCHYEECRDYFNVILNVIIMNVIILNVVRLSVVAPFPGLDQGLISFANLI